MDTQPILIDEKILALRNNLYFSTLSPLIQEEVAAGMTLRRYSPGEIILWHDEPSTYLYILQCGSVKLFRLSPRGRELIIRVLRNGSTFNEVPVFDGGPNVVNAAALEESLVWAVDAAVLRKVMDEHHEMCEAVIQNLAKNMRQLIGLVEELSFYQVTNRLARLINQLPIEQLEGPSAQRITQDQMAARLGTVREVVARSLRDLERSGAIRVHRRQISILNRDLLREWSQEP